MSLPAWVKTGTVTGLTSIGGGGTAVYATGSYILFQPAITHLTKADLSATFVLQPQIGYVGADGDLHPATGDGAWDEAAPLLLVATTGQTGTAGETWYWKATPWVDSGGVRRVQASFAFNVAADTTTTIASQQPIPSLSPSSGYAKGDKGDKGDTGDTGPTGPTGVNGTLAVAAGQLVLPGVNGSYVQTPDSAGLRVAGDLDLRWYGTLANLASGGFQTLAAKQNSTATSWNWRLTGGGNLSLLVSHDGTTLITASANAVTPAATGYRCTWRQSDGRVQFFIPYATARTFTDGVVVGGSLKVLTSATAAFTSADVGATVTGTGVAAGTTITTVDSATQVHVNNNMTAGTGQSITLGVTLADASKWNQLGTDRTASTSNTTLYTTAGVPVTIGALGNGTSPIAAGTTMTKFAIRNGLDGTLVASPTFTGHTYADTAFTDAQSNVWTVAGAAVITPISGSITLAGSTLTLTSPNDVRTGTLRWGAASRHPVTGWFHVDDFGPLGVNPANWTVAQTGTAVRAARAAAVAVIDLANKRGACVYFGGRVYEVDADTSLNDPYSGLPFCAIKTWDYLTFRGAGFDATTIKLTSGANCHVFGPPGRYQSNVGHPNDGQQDQIFNTSWVDLTIDGNKAGQNGTHNHDGLRISQHPGLRLRNVHLTNCDGNGYYSTANGDLYISPATNGGVNIVRPVTITDCTAEGNARWGWFMSATNRDCTYKGVHAYGNGSPQARLAGKTVAVNLTATGTLSLLVDGNAQVNVALTSGDTPASVVTKINTALGTKIATAACTISRYRVQLAAGVATSDAVFDGAGNLNSAAMLAFTSADVGQLVMSPNVPRGTKIATYISATHVTLTNAGTAGSNVAVSIGTNIIATAAANSGTWTVGATVSGAGIPITAKVGAVVNGVSVTIVDGSGNPLTPKVPAGNSTGLITIAGKGTASLTASGRLLISSDTTGGISQVFLVNSSTAAILTNLGLTTTPVNGENTYRCGSNEYGGFYLDHSECLATGLIADSNYGDGFYVHNVNATHYLGLHATRNSGFGIYVDAWDHSSAESWYSGMNCPDFGVASYRVIAFGRNRVVTDGVTATSTSLTSATAAFTAADVGAVVIGAGIAAGTAIKTFTNSTTVVLTKPTTATASGVTVTFKDATAECYFDNGTEGYGVTQDSTLAFFSGPGDKATIGNDLDNRFAEWSMYIANGIAGSFDVFMPKYGDGGIVGTIQDSR